MPRQHSRGYVLRPRIHAPTPLPAYTHAHPVPVALPVLRRLALGVPRAKEGREPDFARVEHWANG